MKQGDIHAFPVTHQGVVSNIYAGMTLRDYFAAAALPHFLHREHGGSLETKQRAAREAYLMADMMLRERDK